MSAQAEPIVTGGHFGGSVNDHPQAGQILPKSDNYEMQPKQFGEFQAWVPVPLNPSMPGAPTISFLAPEPLRNLAAPHPVKVQLVYLDQAAGRYHLSYDSGDPQTFPHYTKPGAGKPLPTLVTAGSGVWKRVAWLIPDARFGGNLNGADLKLQAEGPVPLTILGIYIDSTYPLGDDSKPQPGVPHGDVLHLDFRDSRIFPGTDRAVSVYVPKQYDGSKPACVWIDQDGMNWNDANVLDNLIARKEVPVIIDIAITPGRVDYPGKTMSGMPGGSRANRQFEYDVMSDDYVRFLLDEIFPAVEKLKTPDGRALKLSRNGNDCGIGGASSGGICALNAAWQRPDAFTRVLSAIGSFEDLHGGDRFPDLIRKTEPKPIRVFLQDGSNDLNIFAGDWFMNNQRMERSLTFAGYEHEHIWGDNGHDAAEAVAAFPDILRFLWKGWPAPVKTSETKNDVFRSVFGDNKEWRQVWKGNAAPVALAVNDKGEVFFNDPATGQCSRIGADGAVNTFGAASGDAGMAFGSDGRLYALDSAAGTVTAADGSGSPKVIARGIHGSGIVALPHGRFYVTEPGRDGSLSRIWLVGSDGSKKIVDSGGDYCAGPIAIDAPSDGWVSVGDSASHWIDTLQALPDGTLRYRQRFTQLEEPVIEGNAEVKGVCAVGEQLIAATQLGLQIAKGSIVAGIVPVPGGAAKAVVLGAPAFDLLYVSTGTGIYTRQTKLHGAPPPKE
jgi:enterochelin esterase-like enzyme